MNETVIKKPHPVADTVTLVLFFILIFGICIWGVLLPDRTYSENENRNLTQFPEFTLSRLFDGSWMSDFSEYLSDQVPMRDEMVAFHAAAERFFGKQENSGVIAGKDGYLFEREDYPSSERLQSSLLAIDSFAAYAKERGVPTYLAIAGRKIDVATDFLPALYGTQTQEQLWEQIDEMAAGLSHLTYLNLRDVLRSDTSGKQLYYKTDHHWTAEGAMLAYQALGRELGLTVREDGFFERELVAEDFYGTTWSNSAMTWTEPDEMYYLRWTGDMQIKTDVGMKVLDGFYDRSKLTGKDKYASFFGAQYGYMEIRGEEEGREKLLVIKDSFAHAVLPMLAADYDIDVLDMRYYTFRQGFAAEILENGDYDGVLILCSTPLLTDQSTKESGRLPMEELLLGMPQ